MPIYPGDSNRRIGRKNENDNPVRVVLCSSIITLIFGFFMTFRGSDMYLEKLEQPAKRLFLYCCFPGKFRE